MAVKKSGDVFANMAFLGVTESAANTLTFAQLQLANALMSEKVAMVIHRIQVFSSVGPSAFNASGDQQRIAVCLTDRLTDIQDLSQPEILTTITKERWDFGAAASGMVVTTPLDFDFNAMPGGGILVPADRIYVGVQGLSLAVATSAYIRLWYTIMPLSKEDFWDLIEARRIMTT